MKYENENLAMISNPMYVAEIQFGEVDSMSEVTVAETIDKLSGEITAEEMATRKKKEMVNTLCTVIGRAPAYAIAEAAMAVPTSIRSDQFYGQPLASAVRTILEMRKQRGLGAATNNEIYDALTAGGYEFDTKSDDIARKSLRNSIAKNTALFHKLPNGQFGLLSWYPNVKKPRAQSASPEEVALEAINDAINENSAEIAEMDRELADTVEEVPEVTQADFEPPKPSSKIHRRF
ncbi:MAG: hypothetical protein P4M05_02155 [Bradyrhizobium sp.]|nr:hypothetical protein [Bradyrhizobium sp.]